MADSIYSEIERNYAQANSITDSLTGIYNRRHFDDTLRKEFFRLKRTGYPLSIIIFDIDYFKKYNDTYGHLQGDQCLKDIALKVKEIIKRENDTFARYGGEEFVLLIKNYGSKEVIEKRLQQLCREIETTPVDRRQKHETNIPMTASFGYAFSDGKTSAEDLLLKADEALYKAKQGGRNTVVMAQSS